LSQEALDSLDLREAGAEHVRRLQRRTGNTVHLAALMDRSIVYVDKAEDESGVRMYSRIGKAVIPYCSAVGKAILANLDAAGRDAVLDGVTWERHTDRTHHSRRAARPRAGAGRRPRLGRRRPGVRAVRELHRGADPQPARRRRRDLGHRGARGRRPRPPQTYLPALRGGADAIADELG
jgi:DNA-binding IclR family transcriptional regulator